MGDYLYEKQTTLDARWSSLEEKKNKKKNKWLFTTPFHIGALHI